MMGLVIAAYFGLSLFDHAARADDGLRDQIQKVERAGVGGDLADNAKKDRSAARVDKRPSIPKIHGSKSKESKGVAVPKAQGREVDAGRNTSDSRKLPAQRVADRKG